MNAIRDSDTIRIYGAYSARESIKEIPGRRFDPADKAWVVPYTRENAAMVALIGADLDSSLLLNVDQEDAGDEVPIIPMPIKVTPYQHQVRAYNFALRTFGIRGTA